MLMNKEAHKEHMEAVRKYEQENNPEEVVKELSDGKEWEEFHVGEFVDEEISTDDISVSKIIYKYNGIEINEELSKEQLVLACCNLIQTCKRLQGGG